MSQKTYTPRAFSEAFTKYWAEESRQGNFIFPNVHTISKPFIDQAKDLFKDKDYSNWVESVNSGARSPGMFIQYHSNDPIIHFVGLRGKTCFNATAESAFRAYARDLLHNSRFLDLRGNPPAIISGEYNPSTDRIVRPGIGEYGAHFQDKTSCFTRFQFIGSSFDYSDVSALHGKPSKDTESLYLLFELSDPQKPEKKRVMTVTSRISPSQFKYHKTVLGGYKAQVEIDSGVSGADKITQEVDLDELAQAAPQFIVPTLNLAWNVLQHNVRPNVISQSIVEGRDKNKVKLTEPGQKLKQELQFMRSQNRNTKMAFLSSLRKGEGDVIKMKTPYGNEKICPQLPFEGKERRRDSTWSALVLNCADHYLLLNADPAAILLTGYSQNQQPTAMSMDGEPVTIEEIDTGLMDILRLFEPPTATSSIFKSQEEYKAHPFFTEHFLPNSVIHVDSDHSFEVVTAYLGIIQNTMYYPSVFEKMKQLVDTTPPKET